MIYDFEEEVFESVDRIVVFPVDNDAESYYVSKEVFMEYLASIDVLGKYTKSYPNEWLGDSDDIVGYIEYDDLSYEKKLDYLKLYLNLNINYSKYN